MAACNVANYSYRMSGQPDHGTPLHDNSAVVTREARDPRGVEYKVLIIREYGVSQRRLLGRSADGPSRTGWLGAVNRLVSKHSRVSSEDHAAVAVMRVGAGGEAPVHYAAGLTPAAAHEAAATLVADIEAGRFQPSPNG